MPHAFLNTWDLPVYRGELIDLGDSGVGWIPTRIPTGEMAPMGLTTEAAMRGEDIPDLGNTILDRIDPAFPRRAVRITQIFGGTYLCRIWDPRPEFLANFDKQIRWAREMSMAMSLVGDLSQVEDFDRHETPAADFAWGSPIQGGEIVVKVGATFGYTGRLAA